MTYKALQIADEIMRLANAEDKNITSLKLIKICYFVHAWSLALGKNTTLEENVQAWMHGPVIPEIYHKFKYFGNTAISYQPSDTANFTKDEKAFIKSVWDRYKVAGGVALRNLTHENGSPWSQVYDGTLNNPIDNDIIKSFYQKKVAS